MKSKILFLMLALCMIVTSFSACANQPYDYKFDDYMELGDYSNISILLSDIRGDIMEQYREIIDASEDGKKAIVTYDKTSEKKETIRNHDVVNIDYVGKVDGTEFAGGNTNGKGTDLAIGSNSYIDDFEEQLIDAKVGDQLTIKVTFPEDYSEITLRNKEAEFTVTVNSIKRYPDYTDENIKKYSKSPNYATVAAFESAIRPDIERELVWAEFYMDTKMKKYPKDELESYYDAIIKNDEQTMAYYAQMFTGMNLTFESYLKSFKGQTIDTYYTDTANQAKAQVKREMIIFAMLDKVPVLKMSESEYMTKSEALWKEYVDENQYDGTLKDFRKEYDREAVEMTLYYDIVVDYIFSKYTVVPDTDGLKVEKAGIRYYVNEKMQTGWQKVDLDGNGEPDKCYFHDETGLLITGNAYVNPEYSPAEAEDVFCKFNDKGVYEGKYNGFYNDGKNIFYFESGYAYKSGWKEIEGNKYYFYSTGYAATGDATVMTEDGANDMLGRFDASGIYQMELMGWITTPEGTRYYKRNEDGTITMCTKEAVIDGYTYYFGGINGYLAVPADATIIDGDRFVSKYENMYMFLKVADSEKYAIDKAFTDFYSYEGKTYYFREGVALVGWQLIDDAMYFFSPADGVMAKGDVTIADKPYTFGADGKLSAPLNGIVSDGAKLMFFNNNVAVENGWIDADGDGNPDYYAKDRFVCTSMNLEIEGKTYAFDAEGKFTEVNPEGGSSEG